MRPRQSQGEANAPTPIQVIEDRMPQSRKEKDSVWAVGVEIFAWNLRMLFYGFLYNPLGVDYFVQSRIPWCQLYLSWWFHIFWYILSLESTR